MKRTSEQQSTYNLNRRIKRAEAAAKRATTASTKRTENAAAARRSYKKNGRKDRKTKTMSAEENKENQALAATTPAKKYADVLLNQQGLPKSQRKEMLDAIAVREKEKTSTFSQFLQASQENLNSVTTENTKFGLQVTEKVTEKNRTACLEVEDRNTKAYREYEQGKDRLLEEKLVLLSAKVVDSPPRQVGEYSFADNLGVDLNLSIDFPPLASPVAAATPPAKHEPGWMASAATALLTPFRAKAPAKTTGLEDEIFGTPEEQQQPIKVAESQGTHQKHPTKKVVTPAPRKSAKKKKAALSPTLKAIKDSVVPTPKSKSKKAEQAAMRAQVRAQMLGPGALKTPRKNSHKKAAPKAVVWESSLGDDSAVVTAEPEVATEGPRRSGRIRTPRKP